MEPGTRQSLCLKEFGSDKKPRPVALQLGKGIVDLDISYRRGTEEWGIALNRSEKSLHRSFV